MTTADAGFAPASLLVATLNVLAEYEPAAGFVMPAIWSVAVDPFGSAQVPPLFASVIVTVVPVVLPAPLQFANGDGSVTVGVAGIVKAGLKTTVTVSPAARAEPAPFGVEKPTVQVEVKPADCGLPVKVTPLIPGSIVYGSGRERSFNERRSSVLCAPRASVQCAPAGVTSRPPRSTMATGGIESPLGRSPARRATDPSGITFGLRLRLWSFHDQVRTPWCRSTVVSSSKPPAESFTSSWPKEVVRAEPCS